MPALHVHQAGRMPALHVQRAGRMPALHVQRAGRIPAFAWPLKPATNLQPHALPSADLLSAANKAKMRREPLPNRDTFRVWF